MNVVHDNLSIHNPSVSLPQAMRAKYLLKQVDHKRAFSVSPALVALYEWVSFVTLRHDHAPSPSLMGRPSYGTLSHS